MSVLKLSKNDIIRNEDKEEKIKLKRSDLSFDSARVSGWEQANRQSLDILNDYNNRINKSEWLDKEDRAKYRSALDSYIETSNLLRGINKTFGEGYSEEDEQKWTDSIASMNQAYDSTEKYYSQWIDEKDYKGQREDWFQSSNLFDDGYQFGDVTKTVVGSATDLVENIGAGIMGMGEAALDALLTLGVYAAQGQYYSNGGGYNLHADQAFDQSIDFAKKGTEDFVKKDLYDEQAVAKTIIAEPVKALTGIDAETDSVFGKKSDSLVQSAGQLVGTAGLQAVGVPWWLTTGVTSFGGESENALRQGATLEEAAFSGLVSAGAEILTEKISGGISFGGKTLDDFLPQLTAKISHKTVRILADLGLDMMGEGAEEVLSGVMSAIGQKMTYASDKEWNELLSSEEALDSFIGGAVLGLGGSVIGKGVQTMSDNKKASEIYGNGAELVTEALEIDPNNVLAHKMQAKLDKGKSLSGGQINRLVEANEQAIKSNPEVYEEAELSAEPEQSTNVATEARQNTKGVDAKNATTTEAVVSLEQDDATTESSVETIEAITEKGVTLKLKDGTTVPATEVNFKNSDIGLVYQAATDMSSRVGGFNVDTANVFVRGYSPDIGVTAAEYVHGWSDAYRFGKLGFPSSELVSGEFTSKIPENIRNTAYNFGKAFGNDLVTQNFKTNAQIAKNGAKISKTDAKVGKVIMPEGVDTNTLTPMQRDSIKGLEIVSQALGKRIHLFESEMVDGKRVGANGWYDPTTGDIHLDIHAGIDGRGAMLFTGAHELTHDIRVKNPQGFKRYADAVLDSYVKHFGKDGLTIEGLIREKLDHLERNKRLEGKTEEEAYDLAYEEVIADSAESMLTDSKAFEEFSKRIQKEDKSLWEKIKQFFSDLVKKIKAAYKEFDPDSLEGKLLREMGEDAERLQKLWVDALMEAADAGDVQVLADNGIIVDSKTESASLYSIRDVLTDADRKKVSKALAERFGVTQTEAMDWLKAETSLASLILNPKYSQYLDYTADPNEEAIKSNSDYPQGTVDFSNICKKRRDFTEVMNRVLRNFPNHVFAATDLAKIRTIMEQEGMEVACAICYVEDRRQLDSVVAQDFIDSLAIYREGGMIRPDGKPFNANQLKAFKLIDGDTYTPSIYELISLEGRNSLKAKNPAMEEAWVKFNNARGMQSVRLLLNDAEYKRQILKYTPAVVKRKNDLGGLRIYSFSDMEMFHLIDIIQVITDSATVGLSLQGYTKVNEYARAVKDTGEKLNRSLIPKGDLGYHMENGRVVLDFDTTEGIDINHPDFFDNIDNPNVGNIVIGINATQIKAAMTSKFIDQIIPFHTGQSGEVLGEKGIAAWDNYKDFQSERDVKTQKKSSHQINIYTEVINAAEAEGHPITNKVEFVNKFLQVCKENNLIPRFSDFLNVDENGDYVYTEGYHKFLVDFKTFDQNTGEYLPQMPVKPIFDNEYITKLLTDYVKSQQAKDAEFTKAMPKVLNRITNEIVKPDGVKYSDRFSQSSLEKYSKKEYNSFGWARAVDAISFNELDDLYSKIQEKSSLSAFNQSSRGEAIIEVNNKPNSTLDVDNVFVFVKGTRSNFAITRVVRFQAETETEMEILKEDIYEGRTCNDTHIAFYQEEGIAREYRREDFPNFDEYREGRGDRKTSGGTDQNYRRSSKYRSGYTLIVGEDGEVTESNHPENIEYRYSDREQVEVYHGSKANFENFDFSYLEDELGAFFTENENDASQYGDAKAYTLSPKKTLVVHQGEEYRKLMMTGETDAEKRARLIKEGYDTIKLIYNKPGGGETVDWVVLTPDVINKTKYSDRDSEGNTLSKAQQEFFKDSKVRDEDGNLLKVYHGSPNKFTTFRQGVADGWGKGIYFTNNRADASTYGKNVVEAYLNIKNPYNADTMSYDDIGAEDTKAYRDFDKQIWEKRFAEYDSYEEYKADGMGVDLYEIYTEEVEVFNQILRELGYDGIIAYGSNDINGFEIVAFSENQPKLTSNKNPSEGKDIRYSDRNTATFKGKPFWSGSVSLLDGVIEEVHTIEEAEAADFHHSMYFSQAQIEKMENEENAFFFVENGEVQGDWRVSIPESIIERIKDQITTKLSDRNPDSYSNRSLLAGALETAVQNDIEREKLKQYKQKIDLINSEEQKLHDLREQIKELSFRKGPRDTQAIKSLQFEANQAANRINTYDKQLLNLESTKALRGVLEREKALARKRDAQKYKESLERYREKAAKTQRELMDRYQESRKRGTENRNKTAMRHKIKDVVNELNNYLLKGTKDKHVPIELQKAVAEALDAVNMDTVGAEERIAKKRAEMMSAKTLEAVERLAKEIEHIQEMGGNMEAKLSRLKTAYDSIINSDDPLIANSHDEVISNTIDHVMEFVGNTPLRDMSLPQLEAVYDMYRMVLHSIRAANKAFKAKKSEEISVIANRVMEEIDKQGKKKLQSKAGQTISEFNWNNQKPVYAFERIGSDSFTEVFSNVRAGEDTWAVDMTEAQEFLKNQKQNHKYDSWDRGKRFGFTSTSGMHFELSLDQIMSLYAYSKREQAAEHLKRGGIVFDETTEVTVKNKLGIPVKFNPTEATAYNISEETLADIISKLTPDQKAFVDKMQDYLSTTMGEKGNEVSLELYGVKLFKEKHYFPLKSATQFMAKAKEQQKGEVKIKNKGFTKETVYKANNPIVLTPFMDVWAGHVNEMSMYHSFTLALEDFYRVYNYKTPTSETMATESVEMFLQNAHGKAATKYIDQLLKDLNGGALSDPRETPSKALMSNFKKASVIASLSVVIQQPSAIVRAQALVDAKYFVGKPSKHKDAWAEVKKYAPVAVIKEMGYFDTGMGKGAVEWLKGDKTFKDKMDDALAKAPSLADEYTWCAIWNAVKRETARKNPSMKTSSEEFLNLAGERFTEVIVKTQVYDSVLARSANMRSKSAFMNMLTAFLAEPTTSINMLQDAFKKGNKKQIARTMGAVYGSVVLNSALVAIVYAMRDDDEDETFLEKYMSRLTTEVIDGINPLTYVPFVKDIWSAAQGFDVERADMTLITKTLDSLQQLIKIAGKDTSDMDDEELREHNKKVNEAILSITDNLASLTGLPVKNIRRDINGIINGFNTIKTDIEGRETTAGSLKDNILEDVKDSLPVVGWLPGENKGDKLYDAIISGDEAYVERLKSGYTSEDSYNSAIRKALRENDPRIKEAAEAYLDGDYATYNSLRDKIVSEGVFDRTLVTDALKAEVNLLKKKAKEAEENK